MAGLGAAVEFMQELNTEALEAYEAEITKKALQELSTIEGCIVYGQPGTYYGQNYEKTPLFSMAIDGAHPSDIAQLLDRMGIAVRSGMLCAEPLLERYGQTALLRASFALYNTVEELEFFMEALKKALCMLR